MSSASTAAHLRAFAPASIGNVAAGFDVLGAALAPVSGEAWGDAVEVASAASFSFRVAGPHAAALPPDAGANLVVHVHRLFE